MDNKGYRIFIVGIYGHPNHIIRFVRNLKLSNPLVEIALFSDRPYSVFSQEIGEFIEEYIQWKKSVRMPSRWRRSKFLNRVVGRILLIMQFIKLSRRSHYDIVNVHYPQYFMSYVMGCLKKMSTVIVVSPWGSDVLRLEGKRKRQKLARVFRKANYITTDKMGDIGKILVDELGIDENKLYPLAWGSEAIDYINDHFFEVSVEEAKRWLGLENRYVITCGYNAFEEQRHEMMIKTIATIKHQLPDNLTLLFPVTYGCSYGTRKKEYVEQIKQWCKESELDAVYYEDYLSVADLLYLRQGTDMFVHIQTTDADSSSLQEYVLCGKKVVHGTWIHYPNLEQYKPLFYFPVDGLEHLGETILNAYHSDHIEVPAQVLDYIRNRGWKAKMKLWNDFFVSIS